MDHDEACELLDLAAVEPGGLERLMAGDTPAATALAGHLAGCPECTQEFGRLRRSATVLRGVVSTMPPPELRERTLAFVAAVGRPRDRASVDAPPVDFAGAPVAGASVTSAPSRRRRLSFAWLAAAAALVVVTAVGSGIVVGNARDTAARQAAQELEGLTEVASWTVRLDSRPDVRHVLLTSSATPGNGGQLGTLVFSPGSQELVVVADGIAAAPAGMEYRCWVEVGGARQRLGRMYISGTLAYWVGDAPVLANVPAGSVFGVSLAGIGATGGAGPAILSGTLPAS